jgi:hypothetical protein
MSYQAGVVDFLDVEGEAVSIRARSCAIAIRAGNRDADEIVISRKM